MVEESREPIRNSELQRAIEIAMQAQNEGLMRRYLEVRQEFIVKDFERIQTYNSILLTLAFGGFFAIWNYVSDQMHPWDTVVVASSLGLSLFLFVTWTIVAAFYFSRENIKRVNIFNDASLPLERRVLALEDRDLSVVRRSAAYFWTWRLAFGGSVLSGLIAGVLLFSLLMAKLLGSDFSLYCLIHSCGNSDK